MEDVKLFILLIIIVSLHWDFFSKLHVSYILEYYIFIFLSIIHIELYFFVLFFFKILEKLLSNIPNSLGEDDRKQIADTTHGYVGADILCLCQQGTSCLADMTKIIGEWNDCLFAIIFVCKILQPILML